MISKIAKYTIEKELGRGGFGCVYRAYDPSIPRWVAIKVLMAESDPELLKRFQLEIVTTGSLTHKNIVTLYECGEESGVPYLVMELLEGETLESLLKRGATLSLLDKVRIMSQVAEGLGYAHSKGVVHRDVKPGNIMLLSDGTVKIMDFGIARVANRNTRVTREGFILGTVPYMAPEQFDPGATADQQTDIFSYGDVYYELLTGVHPFMVKGDIYASIHRIRNFEPEAVSRLLPGCPEAVELLVLRALGKDREIRYSTFQELLLDSESVLVDLRSEHAATLLAEVPALMEKGDLDAAERKLVQVLEFDPGNREARQWRTQVRAKLDQGQLAQHVQALLEESDRLIAERQFSTAVQKLETALRARKTDEALQKRLAEANALLQAHNKANRLVAEARRDQQKGQWSEALKRVKAAQELDPHHTDANTLRLRLESELERQARQQRWQQSMQAASEHLARKRPDEALAALTGVEADSPSAASQLAELRARIEQEKAAADVRRLVEQAKQHLARHELTLAAGVLERLAREFANDPEVPGLLAQLQAEQRAEAIRSCAQQARDLLRQKRYQAALQELKQGLSKYPGDPVLSSLQEKADALHAAEQRKDALAQAMQRAQALRKSQDFTGALVALADAEQQLGSDPALGNLRQQYERELAQQRYTSAVQQLLQSGRALLDAGREEVAIRTLESAPAEQREASAVVSLLAAARGQLARRQEDQAITAALEEARTHEKQGAANQALALLEEALRAYPKRAELTESADRLRQRIADEQRRVTLANYRAQIEAAIAARQWSQAESGLAAARLGCAGEPLWDELAQEVERRQFDAGLHEATRDVRDLLQSNCWAEAAERVRQTRLAYAEDPRWQALEREVETRCAYEAELVEAAAERQRGELARAEERLARVIAGPDERAKKLWEELREERFRQEVTLAEQQLAQGAFDAAITLLDELVSRGWADRVSDLRRRAEAEREQARGAAVKETAARIRSCLRSDDTLPQASTQLADARNRYPQEAALWDTLKREITERAAVIEALGKANEHQLHGRFAEAEKCLRALSPASADDASRVQTLLTALAAQRAAAEQATALALARKTLQKARKKGKLADLIALLERLEREFPEQAEFRRELQSARRETTDSSGRQPIPWLWIGGAATVLVGGALAVVLLLKHPPPPPPPPPALLQFEVRTDPPGAAVRVGTHSCVTPNCRLSLPAGEYRVEAQLGGYEPAQQTVTMDASNNTRVINLALQPVPPPPPPTNDTGTLTVRTTVPGVLVRIDKQPRGRTDEQGVLSVALEAQTHSIEVEKTGYDGGREQRVLIARNKPRTVEFRLSPQNAKLEIRGAPAGVEVRVGSTMLGKTNGAAVFTASLPPGDGVLQVTDGAASRQLPERFDPGQTVSLNWTSVAPVKVPAKDTATTTPSEEALEAQAWEKVRNATEPAPLDDFMRKHPNSGHAGQVRERLDELAWSRTDQHEQESLREYLHQFPRGKHEQDANRRIIDIAWNGVNKKDGTAVKAFVDHYPNSFHQADAQIILDQLEAQKTDAARHAAEEASRLENQRRQVREQGQGIQSALDRFNAAFEGQEPKALKQIWPSVSRDLLNNMGRSDAKTTITLRAAGEPRVEGLTAVLRCTRTVKNVLRGQASQEQKLVEITLQKNGEIWLLIDPVGRPVQ